MGNAGGNASGKYAPPEDDGGYTNLAKHPPAAPSVGRVGVTGGRKPSSKSTDDHDDDGAPRSSKKSVSGPSDNLDKSRPHRSAITAPDLRRFSSVSSDARARPDEPYEAPQTSAITDKDLQRIKRVGGDDNTEHGNDTGDGPPRDKAAPKRVSFSSDGVKDQAMLGTMPYTLQSKKPSHHIAMIVKPSSGLIGLQPGSLAVGEDSPDAPARDSRRPKPISTTSSNMKYR